jgi:hypothetical protein
MEGKIDSICSKLEETIKNRVDDVLSSVDWWTQYLCKEPSMKIEGMQLGLQAVTMSLDTWARSLHEEILDTKEDLHKVLNLWIRGTQVER